MMEYLAGFCIAFVMKFMKATSRSLSTAPLSSSNTTNSLPLIFLESAVIVVAVAWLVLFPFSQRSLTAFHNSVFPEWLKPVNKYECFLRYFIQYEIPSLIPHKPKQAPPPAAITTGTRITTGSIANIGVIILISLLVFLFVTGCADILSLEACYSPIGRRVRRRTRNGAARLPPNLRM